MPLKSLTCAALLVLAAAPAFARTASAAYKSAIAVDAATGAVLFEDNADAVSPPASMTKLMTFAVVADALKQGRLSLDTPIRISRKTARVAEQSDSSKVGLRQGETFTVEELIYAAMIRSANDAAYALAEQVGGTADAFIPLMNQKARELGMLHSTFRTPNGFPVAGHRAAEGDLTSPRDYSLLCRHLLLHTDILKYTSVRSRAFGAGVRAVPEVMTNHNNLLGRIPGVDGLKTGFTSAAGFCLSCTALRNGHRVIVVMMDSPDARTRDQNIGEVLDEAFLRVPVAEPPFAAGAGLPAATPAGTPAPGASAPTRPAPEGPVITLPGR